MSISKRSEGRKITATQKRGRSDGPASFLFSLPPPFAHSLTLHPCVSTSSGLLHSFLVPPCHWVPLHLLQGGRRRCGDRRTPAAAGPRPPPPRRPGVGPAPLLRPPLCPVSCLPLWPSPNNRQHKRTKLKGGDSFVGVLWLDKLRLLVLLFPSQQSTAPHPPS